MTTHELPDCVDASTLGPRAQEAIRQGNAPAGGSLLDDVYDELRRKAHALYRNERLGHTLRPTDVLHEAYVRLSAKGGKWNGRSHFVGAVVITMKRVLVDYARARETVKRGGRRVRITLADGVIDNASCTVSVLELNQALDRLGDADPDRARVAELVLLGGLTTEEIADLLGTSRRTVQRQWEVAKAFLVAQLGR